MKKGKFIAYYRVSTKQQGNSGLGLEAQKSSVESKIKSVNGTLVAEFQEVESGKKNSRVELEKAIVMSRETGSTLIIAKLDRLSRDVEFLFKLKNSGIQFVALDIPEMNTMNIAIFGGIAQHERELISSRTKAALAELKKQGIKLGKNNLTDEARRKGSKTMHERFLATTEQTREIIRLKRIEEKDKKLSYRKLAQYLNEKGFR